MPRGVAQAIQRSDALNLGLSHDEFRLTEGLARPLGRWQPIGRARAAGDHHLRQRAALGLSLAYPLSVLVLTALVGVVLALAAGRRETIVSIGLILLHIVCLRLRLWYPGPVVAIAFAASGLLALVHLTWLIARATFGPGPITRHRIGGAVTIYFNIALIFSVAYRLTNELSPGSFNGIPRDASLQQAADYLLYFSMIALSTTGFGDITPASPMAHSLASLEAVVGQLYIATFLGRLITLNTELIHSRHDTGGKSDD